ncbi:hypothetical protein ACHAXR_005519 [Thalassiosira sp. AJA248-18]
MKRIIDTTTTKKNSSTPNKGVSRRTPRLSRRSIPSHALRNLLYAGIVWFASGIFVLHWSLTEIEPNHAARDLRRGSASGSSGKKLPPDQDPRLQKNNNHRNPGRAWGSEKGRVKCDQEIYRLVSYWNDPRSDVDRAFQSPFLEAPSAFIKRPKRTRYLSFEPDSGGWNNIRMEFETMVVLAAATGRTLVLPPDNPLYLLSKDKDKRHRGLQHFFQEFDDVVETISTEDLFQKEMLENKYYPLPTDEKNRTGVMDSLQKCEWRAKSEKSCIHLYEYMSQVADYVPDWHSEHHCLIMDDQNWFRYETGHFDDSNLQKIQQFCAQRKPISYNKQIHDAPLLHFRSHFKDTRLLAHFYAFIHFTNPKIDNYYKRLVRDRVRYSDEIFCAAGKIVKSLIEESMGRHFNGAGAEAGYFSMHIRRGDFQWPKMKLSAEEWHYNTKSWLEPDDQHLLYIATDEADRSFFEPLMKHYKVRFLDDYSELVNLSNLDPNYVGMIDQIVASKARDFVGTYFSSFSAYIGRMRGYHAISGKRMFYSHRKYWNATHSWVYPHASYPSREFPLGWVGIDEDYEQNGQDFY